MTQPDYVPPATSDRVRPSERLSTPAAWRQDRPADLTDLTAPTGPRFGRTGPDMGYGLKLARRFESRLELAPGTGETADDAIAGCFACGGRRAAGFGRAPVSSDMEWAYVLWGYLGAAPADLVAARVPLFRGASHHYWDQRRIVDTVADSALRLTPAQVRDQLGTWRSMLTLG